MHTVAAGPQQAFPVGRDTASQEPGPKQEGLQMRQEPAGACGASQEHHSSAGEDKRKPMCALQC